MTSQHTISSITKYTRYHHKACILSLKQQNLKTLIDVARYKSLIEQSYSFTIRYFDWSDSFCDLVTWPTIISDDTLAFLFNKCNMDCCSFYQKFMSRRGGKLTIQSFFRGEILLYSHFSTCQKLGGKMAMFNDIVIFPGGKMAIQSVFRGEKWLGGKTTIGHRHNPGYIY